LHRAFVLTSSRRPSAAALGLDRHAAAVSPKARTMTLPRPFVTLHVAQTLEGQIAATGDAVQAALRRAVLLVSERRRSR
jgi:hypothetical protein